MAAEKTIAVVLKVVDFSNTSCIVTLFTRDFGKISALAKGARRTKSPFEAALDVLAICRLVFLHKSSESLDLLTEASMERRFRSSSTDLNRLYVGYYFVELIMALTDENDPNVELYELLSDAIQGLDNQESIPKWLLRYEMRLLTLLGHRPSLNNCVGCGKKTDVRSTNENENNGPEKNAKAWIGLIAGGVFCRDCRPGKRAVVSTTKSAITLMDSFAEPDDRWRRMEVKQNEWGECRGIMSQYMSHLLGFRPKLLPYLQPIVQFEPKK